MKNKHMIDNARRLVVQKHPVAVQVMAGKGDRLTDDAAIKVPSDLADPKSDQIETTVGKDLMMRGTSLAHLREVYQGSLDTKEQK